MKKRFYAIVAICMVMALFAGCAADTGNYPVQEAADLTAVNLAEATNSQLTVAYPAEEWTAVDGTEPLTIYWNETVGTKTAVNVNAQVSNAYSGSLTEKDRQNLMKSLEAYEGYMTFAVSEMRMLNDKPIIYTESTMKFTDDYLNMIIEEGIVTEEWLDANGGREAVLSTPETSQVMVYTVREGYICVYVGTYYEAEQRQNVVDMITAVIQGTDVIT